MGISGTDVDGPDDDRARDQQRDGGEIAVMDDASRHSPVAGAEPTPDVTAPTRADRPGRWRWRRPPARQLIHPSLVGALSAAFALTYGTFSVMLHRHYGTFTFDLVIFDQVVHAYSRFQRPTSAVLQASKFEGRDVTQLADHFSPIHASLAPLYWVNDGPATLLLAQAVLFAAAIPAIWIFVQRAIGTAAAYFAAVAFAVSWPMQSALGYDYHEVAFAVPIMAWMLERFQAGRYGQAALVSLPLLLVKEDQGLVVLVFGLLILVKGSRRLGAALAGAGLGGFLLTYLVLMPLAGARPNQNWTYHELGDNPAEGVAHVVTNPLDTLQLVFSPVQKIETMLWLLVPVLFAALASPLAALALPLLLERMLSDNPNHWASAYHYNAFLAPIVFCAAADGARRLNSVTRLRFVGVAWAIGALVISMALLPKSPLYRATNDGWWRFDSALDTAARNAVAHVPNGVWVAAEGNLGPHLSRRCRVIGLDDPYGDTVGLTPWAVVNSFFHKDLADRLERSGYQIVQRDDPYVIMHNPDVTPRIPWRTKSGDPLPGR